MIKQLTISLALLLCFSWSLNAQNFYYSPEGKANLKVSTQKILVQFKSDIQYTQQKQILSTYSETKTLDRENVLPAPKVSLVDLQNVSTDEEIYALIKKLNADENVVYANHFLAHKDGTLHGVTDRLVVKLFTEAQLPLFEMAMKLHPNVENFVRNEFEPLVMEITVKGNKNALEVANEFSELGIYQFSEPDFLRLMKRLNTNDPNVDDQWSLNNDGVNTSQWGGTSGADMSVFAAWGTTTGSSAIKVAILDEGVDLNHPDLQANMLAGYDATGQGSGGGPSGNDAHGTACAGIVAAVGNNNTGGAGVAYGSKIVPVRIAYSSGTSWITNNTWISNALNWSWQTGNADILSNSWGGGGSSSLINGAIDNAINSGRGGLGSPVLFAAGNDNGANSYPATYSPTISVIAMSMCNQRKNPSSCDGETWWGSNYGSGADIAAPGVKIFATDISGSAGYSSGDYTSTFNGTSSATPNAAGVMALILSADGSLTETQARATIESTTDKVGGYSYSNVGGQPNGTWSNDLGYGRVNADAAVQSVSSSTANDAGIIGITSPAGSICASSATPVVTLNNFGSNTLTSVTINYVLDGSSSSYSWTGSLASGSSTNVTLPSISFSSGNHSFDASTNNPNGQADENTANDGSSSAFSSGSNDVTLSITFDNYPEETSWLINDSGGNTVASGGTYGNQADGSTLAINLCLADGCFDFIINDSYGDGICCGFGNGSYTLTEDATGTVLANGGSFGSSETTNFCVPVNTDPPVFVNISSSSNVTCNGGNDGSATASGSGGNGTITYAWSNGSTGTSTSNLSAGTYTVTATSGTSTATASVTISQPSAVVVAISGTNTSGGNNNGSATAAASGGTPGYSYSWSNGGSSATINNLAPGTYTVTATDASNCTDSRSVTIIAGGTPVNVTVSSSSNVSCNGGSDGSATATAGGGNGPITFAWSNGASGATASNLSAGTYTVTATDGNTSSASSIVISEPAAISGTVTGTNANGGNNGSASITNVAGGTSPYSFAWSNGGTTATINNLGPGTYTVTVSDANSCQSSGSVTIVDTGAGCTYETINSNGFESSTGWGIWNDGGSDCRRRSNDSPYAATGTYCIRLRDNTSTSTMTTDNLDLTSYEEITVDFNFYARSMENGEDFWLQISTNGGGSYTTVADYNRGVQFENNIFYTDEVVISGPFTSNTRLRFRNDASGNSDWVYIDDVLITGCTSGNGSTNAGENPETIVIEDKPIIPTQRIEGLNLYPNPTSEMLNIEFDLAETSEVNMVIMNLTGQVVEVREMDLKEGVQKILVETQQFNAGVYFVHFITKDQRVSKKFMVAK